MNLQLNLSTFVTVERTPAGTFSQRRAFRMMWGFRLGFRVHMEVNENEGYLLTIRILLFRVLD